MSKGILFIALLFLLQSCNVKRGEIIRAGNEPELQAALKNLQAGDQIILADGVWKDIQIRFFGRGTAENPVTLRAETPGKVIFEGQSSVKLAGEYLRVEGLYFRNGYSPSDAIIEFRFSNDSIANNCTVTNCAFDEFTKPDRANQDYWIVFWGRHNSITHSYIGGKFNQGPTVKVYLTGNEHIRNYHRIANNHFGPRPRKGGPKAETIQIGASNTSMTPSHTIIENNLFERCNGEVEIISNKSNNCEIRNNVFYECEGSVVLRHGNYCTVDGNFFLGNENSSFCGGIRVINTGHWITNNYFCNINGDEFRAALAIMNGIPKSALNRYNQVTDVVVAFNTWVDCPSPWQISVGANNNKADVLPPGEIRSARPERVELANNLVYSRHREGRLVKAYDRVDGIRFENNIAVNYQDPGTGSGVKEAGLVLDEMAESIFIPSEESARYLSDVYYGFGYEDITRDIFGNTREGNNMVGAMLVPLKDNDIQIRRSDYGPRWYMNAKQALKPVKTGVKGYRNLRDALLNAGDGDTLALEGEFMLDSPLVIGRKIVLTSLDSDNKARITFSGPEDQPLFEMASKGNLHLQNLVLKGQEKQFAFASRVSDMVNSYRLFVSESEISGFKEILHAWKGSMADTVCFQGSDFRDCGKGLSLSAEDDDLGDYNAEMVTIEECSFTGIAGEVVNFYRGGYDESTIGGCLSITNSRFYSCGISAGKGILLRTTGIVNVAIEENIFENNPVKYIAVLWGEKNNTHRDNRISNSGQILVEEFLNQKIVY